MGKKDNAQEVDVIDLANFDKLTSEDGVWMNVLHPVSEKPLTMKLRIIGSDTGKCRNKQHEFLNRRIKKQKINLGSAEQAERDKIELLVACTVGWEGFVENGAEIPFTATNVERVYKQYPFVADQVDEFISDRANFL